VFSRALKRRKKIGAAPAGVVDAFLRELEIIHLPSRETNLLGVWQEEEGGEVVEFMCNV
jgi:hypothetical protein